MKDQHAQIQGYRDFKQETVDMINSIKNTGNTHVVEMVERVKAFHDEETKRYFAEAGDRDVITPDQQRAIREAQKCREAAEEHLRIGFMMLIRSVARPTTEY